MGEWLDMNMKGTDTIKKRRKIFSQIQRRERTKTRGGEEVERKIERDRRKMREEERKKLTKTNALYLQKKTTSSIS